MLVDRGARDLETASEYSNSIGVLRIILDEPLLCRRSEGDFKANARIVSNS
jgi:hypothetical protein